MRSIPFTHSVPPPLKAPSLGGLSYPRSYLGRFVVGVTVTALAVTAIGLSFTPLPLTIAVAVAAVAAIVFIAIGIRHRLIGDATLMFTICGQKEWWNATSKDVILGAVPFEEHVSQLKALGVTNVITLLEDFELEQGIISPATKDQWKAHKIRQTQVKAADFNGVSPKLIGRVLKQMRRVRRRNRKAKFYIHCKAGRGRSATIVLLDRIMQKRRRGVIRLSKQDLPTLVSKELEELKRSRPQINLNRGQIGTVIEYLEKQRKRA